MKAAVMGYGTIGSGVVEVLNINHDSIAKRAGEAIEVKYVLDLRDFPGDPIQDKIVHDYKVIAEDPEIGMVVETMGGVEPAYTFVRAMLEAGKHVTTSNKALVAEKGAELIALAKEKNVNFLFEASVAGGIPVLGFSQRKCKDRKTGRHGSGDGQVGIGCGRGFALYRESLRTV